MKKLMILSISTLLVFSLVQSVIACTCIEPLSPVEALEEADAVFSGEVINVKQRHNFVKVTFKVSCVWKGKLEKDMDVYTSPPTVSCSFPFEKGSEYIVYAYKNRENIFKNKLTTNMCRRTKELSDAEEDLIELGDCLTGRK